MLVAYEDVVNLAEDIELGDDAVGDAVLAVLAVVDGIPEVALVAVAAASGIARVVLDADVS